MTYTQTLWEDRIIDLENGNVIAEGTKVTAARLNKMEGGIRAAHTLVEQLAQLVGGSFVAAPTGTAGLSFSATGLTASWTAGTAYVLGVRFDVQAGSLQLNATQGQYLYVDEDGAVKVTTSQATADAKCPLWYFATDASNAVTSTDRRKIITNLFQSVSDGKALVATAIAGKGGTVPGTAPHTFQQLADGVSSIQRGSGNAQPADVLATKTFSNDSGPGQVGTMPNNGKWNATPGAAAVTIPAGYHDGTGQVAAVSFDASKVLAGTTIAGTAGTMPSRGAPTITPGTTDQILQAGYYSGGTVKGDANLIAANIMSGKMIFGVTGSASPAAAGTAVADSNGMITITGLTFQPRVVVVYGTSTNGVRWGKTVYTPSFSPEDSQGDAVLDRRFVWCTSNGIGPNAGDSPVAYSRTASGFTCGLDANWSGAMLTWFAE